MFIHSRGPVNRAAAGRGAAGGSGLSAGVEGILFREPVEDVDELVQAFRALGLSLIDAVRYAFLDMEAEHGEADAVHRRLGRRELLQDFHTQPRFLHHPPDAANLSLDAVQARDEGLLLGGIEHANTIRQPGRQSTPTAFGIRLERSDRTGEESVFSAKGER